MPETPPARAARSVRDDGQAHGAHRRDQLDQKVESVRVNSHRWAVLPIADKVAHLEEIIERTSRAAPDWVAAACRAKGIAPSSSLAGEEWITGPWATIAGASGFADTLRSLASGPGPLDGVRVRERAGAQLVLDVFPATAFDRILLSGYRAEVWMQPSVTRQSLETHVGRFYRAPEHRGRVDLVLGAGNVTSIAPLDLLYKMFVEGAVGLVKLNPTAQYMKPYLEEILAPLIRAGYLRVVTGDARVGEDLVHHPAVDTVHITGSARTHDTIVFGADERMATGTHGERALTKPITSELGGVGAAIVVPGPWSAGDLRYQAENLATMKLHNGGCNCVALQVLVLPSHWESTERLVDEVRRTIRATAPRVPFYPGMDERRRLMIEPHAQAEPLDQATVPRTLIPDVDWTTPTDVCFTTEAFGGVLATTSLPGRNAVDYLSQAVRFCNDVLEGTLGVTILIHPATASLLGPRLDQALADLRFGTIGVNCWNGLGYLIQRTPWGAFPGHQLDDIQSGRGVVHNTLMLDRSQKSVVHGPFRVFPRSIARGDLHLATKPPWFVSHRRADTVGARLTRFAANPRWRALPAIFPPALRG